MRHSRLAASLVATLALVLAACGSSSGGNGGGGNGGSGAASGACAKGKPSGLLAEVCDRGTIVVSTDPKYPPQSSYDDEKDKYVGFDIDVATEIAKRLGVDIEWQTPSWNLITAGNWQGRWDMSVGSMTPTNDRQKVLYFTQPYYYTPAVVVVAKDNNTVHDVSTDLDGKDIGVCAGCTYDSYLTKSLKIKGYTFDFVIDNAKVHGYDTDTTALQDLQLGRLDAVITSLTTAQGYIRAGHPEKIVGKPVFYEPLAVAFDKQASESSKPLDSAVDKIVGQMHADGTLTKLSKKWYDGIDLTKRR